MLSTRCDQAEDVVTRADVGQLVEILGVVFFLLEVVVLLGNHLLGSSVPTTGGDREDDGGDQSCGQAEGSGTPDHRGATQPDVLEVVQINCGRRRLELLKRTLASSTADGGDRSKLLILTFDLLAHRAQDAVLQINRQLIRGVPHQTLQQVD